MKKTFCDRCGGEFDSQATMSIEHDFEGRITLCMDGSYNFKMCPEMDICVHCWRVIRDFFKPIPKPIPKPTPKQG